MFHDVINILTVVRLRVLKYQVFGTFAHNGNEKALPPQTLPHHIPPPPQPLLPPASSFFLLSPLPPPAALHLSCLALPLSSPESGTKRGVHQTLWRPLVVTEC